MGGRPGDSGGGLARCDVGAGEETLVARDRDDSSFLTIESAVSLDPTLK